MLPAYWNAFGFAVSFLVAFLAVLFLSSQNIMYAFILFGQGHFLLAYLYQWRAGKIGARYAALYVVVLGMLLYLTTLTPEPELWTFVLAGGIFAIHFFVDEMYINELLIGTARALLGFAFVFMYTALLMRSAYGLDAPLAVAALALVACIPTVLRCVRERAVGAVDMFFSIFTVTLIVVAFLPWSISLPAALGFIILFHYVRWYLYYFFKLNANPDKTRLKRYMRDVLIVNGIIIASFLLYVFSSATVVLRYLFEPMYFYVWTVMHVLSSVRVPGNILAWFSPRA